MAEPRPSEIPYQDSQDIFPFLEIRGDIDLVVIAVPNGRTPLQATFPHNHLAVYPKPVLCICGDTGNQGLRNGIQADLLAEAQP